VCTYHNWAAVVVMAGNKRHAVGELGGELIRHDVTCTNIEKERQAPLAYRPPQKIEQSFRHNSTKHRTIARGRDRAEALGAVEAMLEAEALGAAALEAEAAGAVALKVEARGGARGSGMTGLGVEALGAMGLMAEVLDATGWSYSTGRRCWRPSSGGARGGGAQRDSGQRCDRAQARTRWKETEAT
jgi:hypothetical protein